MSTSIIMPGLQSKDEIYIEEREEFVCPLTHQSLTEFNSADFLKEMFNVSYIGPENMRKRSREAEEFCSVAQGVGSDRCVARIRGCNHEFCLLPFLYHVMTSGFTCPLCRHGSNSTVLITDDQRPSALDKKMWKCMCKISAYAREKKNIEQRVEEVDSLIEQQLAAWRDVEILPPLQIVQDVNISAIFCLFVRHANGLHTKTFDFPLQARAIPSDVEDSYNIIYQSGQSFRNVSKMMAESEFFCLQLIASADFGFCTFFQSPIIETPDMKDPASEKVMQIGNHGTNAVFSLSFKFNDVFKECHINGLTYSTNIQTLRAIHMQTINHFMDS